MRKNKIFAGIVIAMAVMMSATACGKNNTKADTKQETKQETQAEAGSEETTAVNADVTGSGQETQVGEETSEEEETKETQPITANDAGDIKEGLFTSKSGKYEIMPPKGWSLDEDGDESVVAITSPNGEDYLEVTYVQGDDADGAREVYPATMDEYKKLISRGEDMEFVRYDVKNSSDGSQTFRYALRYKTPQDGVRYYAISGSYNAATKTYISAAGTIASTDSGVEEQIEAALDSLKLK
ncbi:hypothetical protein [Lacrimispora sp. 38-1]|uniref:hypothetical protein n=1 Tax=Lacrimispora sp. 38-1 TaxID=3125778 RepID=UPI003CFA5B9B